MTSEKRFAVTVDVAGDVLDTTLKITMPEPIPGSYDVIKAVLANELRKFIGISTSDLAKADIGAAMVRAANSVHEPYAPQIDYPVLDSLYMGVLLHRLADKNCECEGNGFNRHSVGVVPCHCVDKKILLDYYEKWWGSTNSIHIPRKNYMGETIEVGNYKWSPSDFMKADPSHESSAEYYLKAMDGRAG